MKRDTKLMVWSLFCVLWGIVWTKFDPSWTAIIASWVVLANVNLGLWLVSRSKWNERRMSAKIDKELADFRAAFGPNGCPVCCLYEYGLIYKLEKPGTRPNHTCLQQVEVLQQKFYRNFPELAAPKRETH